MYFLCKYMTKYSRHDRCIRILNSIISTIIVVSDLPGVPRDFSGVQVQQNPGTRDETYCLVSSSWCRPDNFLRTGNLDYIVNIDGKPSTVDAIEVNGTEGTRCAYIFQRNSCNSINLTVTAMNVCGNGSMSNDVILSTQMQNGTGTLCSAAYKLSTISCKSLFIM